MKTRVVVGCPGSGKSTYAAKIANSLLPSETLILSYSKSASRGIAKKAGTDYRSSTIHSLCFHDMEIKSQQMFLDKQVDELCNRLRISAPNKSFDKYDPDTHFIEVYNFARNRATDIYEAYYNYEDLKFTFAEYVSYVEALKKYKETFDLYEFYDLLEFYDPTSAPKNLLIDESQDLSLALIGALEKLIRNGTKNLWMLGDPTQSIYTYSGSDPKLMYRFEGEEEFLEQSYRCPKAVTKLAKTIFPDVKFLPTSEEGEITRATTIPEDAGLVLVRTNYIRYKILKSYDFLDKNKVMTMHKSKGMQDKHVVIINERTRRVVSSFENDPEPENRVLFTAITRSQNKLTIIDGARPNAIF